MKEYVYVKKFLLEGVRLSGSTESKAVVEGGVLLWSCNWSKGDTFSKIFQKYVNKCKRLGASIIIF